MDCNNVSALILTFNESPNIAACLQSLHWINNVLVLDSGSTDETVAIAKAFKNVKVVVRAFDDHTSQWNYGLEQIESNWVLCLDADYVCPGSLENELRLLDTSCDAYFAEFKYVIYGHPLKATLYPARAVLFQPRSLRYVEDGHTQLLDVAGATCGKLITVLEHHDRKPLSRWLESQLKYAVLEAGKLSESNVALGWKDVLRRQIVLAPALTAFYCLFWRMLFLDGWYGVLYTLQRVYAELLLSLVLLDRKLRRRTVSGSQLTQKMKITPNEHYWS